MSFANTHLPSAGLWGLGHAIPVPQVLLHPPAAPSCSTEMRHSEGQLGNSASSLHPPAAGMCPGIFPIAKMQPPKTHSPGVQMCRDVLGHMERGQCRLCRHVARTWGPCAFLGSTRNALELERKGPS